MPIRQIPNSELGYYLIAYDKNGIERAEPDGSFLGQRVLELSKDTAHPVTDIFFTSHGWKGDLPAAIEQYDAWIGAMAAQHGDIDALKISSPSFKPLVVGLHWPSLPWGDEDIGTAQGGLLSGTSRPGARRALSVDEEVDVYAANLADTPTARAAMRSIIEAARAQPTATRLTDDLRRAYAAVFTESGLSGQGAAAAPGADMDGFDPDEIIEQATGTPQAPGLLGLGDTIRDALLMPLRQASFWKMKDRARSFGETGGNALLKSLQQAAPNARFHLMGHSFGCIVVSATVAGPPGSNKIARPVESLFLVQGALSLWAFASKIPYAENPDGYFRRIVSDKLVKGVIVTTRSTFDKAVGTFYPLGARVKKQLVLDAGMGELPAYGGIGSFGIRGAGIDSDLPMKDAAYSYGFKAGQIVNLEASGVIKNGSGASGAHSDIAHLEVAHAFWSAVKASMPSAGGRGGGGLLGGGPRQVAPHAPSFTAFSRSEPPAAFAEPPAAEPQVAQPAQPPTDVPATRWINAQLEDQPSDQPMLSGQWYTLAFDIDMAPRAASVATVEFAEEGVFEGAADVALTVQLDSTDFTMPDGTRTLRVPRVGKSFNKARFDIQPLHDGPCSAKATIHKDGNFIQQIELQFEVGAGASAAVSTVATGRPASAAHGVTRRDLGLSLSPAAGGYDCIVWGAVASRALLPITPIYLSAMVEAARIELMKVVEYQNASGDFVFQGPLGSADADDLKFALRTMARAGSLLFDKLFFGPAAGPDSKAIGTYLRQMALDPEAQLTLQIVAHAAPLPWAMMYVGDAARDAVLDWSLFLGMRHVIEQIPLQTTLSVFDNAIASNHPGLSVSVNVNQGIDAQMGADFVARQQAFWADALKLNDKLKVVGRASSAQLLDALRNPLTDDQIVYLFCHAETRGLESGGFGLSSLKLDDAGLTLDSLDLDAPEAQQLCGHPLVFINACESATLSPAFYDGFVPYFMGKGARGVVGTECKTPALFASEWAGEFFVKLLSGDSVGSLCLSLRQSFLKDHASPLGLLYAVHCDGDTRITPGLRTR